MKQKISSLLPTLPLLKFHQFTILEMIFSLERSYFVKNFCRLANELFPVEYLRIQIIKQYFLKSSEDPEFTIDHPLRKLNSRYLTCLRQVSKLIENKEIEPLRLPPIEKIMTI